MGLDNLAAILKLSKVQLKDKAGAPLAGYQVTAMAVDEAGVAPVPSIYFDVDVPSLRRVVQTMRRFFSITSRHLLLR